jgi:hypothetical protein
LNSSPFASSKDKELSATVSVGTAIDPVVRTIDPSLEAVEEVARTASMVGWTALKEIKAIDRLA